MSYSRKDFFLSILSGILAGVIIAPLFIKLGVGRQVGILWWNLVWVVPILFVSGTYIGSRLSRFIPWFFQFAKFAAVGFLNTAIDFGILNLLIFLTGITKGVGIIGINSVSFLSAVTNSYFWNKGWTFQLGTQVRAGEFLQFVVVTFIGLLINNSIVFAGTTWFSPLFGLDAVLWVNFVKAAGVVVALIWNFIGYKLIVFRKVA